MLASHLLTFLKYVLLQSKSVRLMMTNYYMILNSVIESLEGFLFSYVYLPDFSLSKDGQNLSFFCFSHSVLVNCYVIQFGQICNSYILFETLVGLNRQIQNKVNKAFQVFSQIWIEIGKVRNVPNQIEKVKNSPRAIKLLTIKVVSGIITQFRTTPTCTLSIANIKFPN